MFKEFTLTWLEFDAMSPKPFQHFMHVFHMLFKGFTENQCVIQIADADVRGALPNIPPYNIGKLQERS